VSRATSEGSSPRVEVHPAAGRVLVEHGAAARFSSFALERVMLTYFEVDPNARFEIHRHESEQITMVLEGELRFDVDGDVLTLGPGDVISLPSLLLHGVSAGPAGAKAVDAWSDVDVKILPGEPRDGVDTPP